MKNCDLSPKRTCIHPGFRFTGCRAVNFTWGVSSNLDRSPLQVRGSWEHCELWKYWWMTWQSKSYPYGAAYSDHVRECPSKWKEVYTPKRYIGKQCFKLDQWLAGMNPAPKPRNWLNGKAIQMRVRWISVDQTEECGGTFVRSLYSCIQPCSRSDEKRGTSNDSTRIMILEIHALIVCKNYL